MESLKALLSRAGGEYARRDAAAKKRVATWEWWTHPGHGVEPLYQQRHGWPVGKKLSSAPKKPTLQNTAYGFDRDGRIVVEREYVYMGRGYYRVFYEWAEDHVAWVRYDYDRRVQAAHRAELDHDRVTKVEALGVAGGRRVATYGYEGETLARIEETFRDGDGRTTLRRYEVAWDGDRLLSIRESCDGGEPKLVYEAARKGGSLDEVLAGAAKKLTAEIPKRVRAMKIREPAYGVVVAFPGQGNDNFPPTVGVGLERERQDLIVRGTIDPSALWNPGDFEHYDTELDADGIAPVYATANRLVSQGAAWKKMSKAFADVARALREQAWSKILPVTKDFVVIAVDYDEKELGAALRAAVSPKTYREWKKKKWAP